MIDSTVRAFQLASEAGTERSIELSAVLRAGKLLLHLGRYAEALALLFPAGRIHTSSSALLLLIGICCLRLERLEDAEDALLEANVLDNRNPEVGIVNENESFSSSHEFSFIFDLYIFYLCDCAFPGVGVYFAHVSELRTAPRPRGRSCFATSQPPHTHLPRAASRGKCTSTHQRLCAPMT